METAAPYAPPAVNRVVAIGPQFILSAPGEGVVITPALEAALRRHYEAGRERLQRSEEPSPFPWPSRYASWNEYINQALHDWLYGPAPVWGPEEDRR